MSRFSQVLLQSTPFLIIRFPIFVGGMNAFFHTGEIPGADNNSFQIKIQNCLSKRPDGTRKRKRRN